MFNKDRIRSGSIIGNFKIIQTIGIGGMGQVFLAVDVRDGTNVAIKILFKDDPSYEMWLKLFTREKEIYELIKHPNVVSYIDSGETEGFHFLVLEHILGVSMRTRLNRDGTSGIITTFSWMQEIILALHAAHQNGFIHRDLKPDNIMVTRDLDIKLIDFGIAQKIKRNDFDDGSEKEPWVGTLSYSAPESIMAHAVTQRADIYSAGLLFYEMITGQSLIQNPFDKEIVLREMKRYESLGHVLPPIDDSILYKEIDKLLYDMLRFAPVDRIPSTGAILGRMEEIAQAVGGSVLTLARDESKQVAQREIADTHLWNALNLIGQGKLEDGLTELSNIGVFLKSLKSITMRMIITQLDLMVLNIRGTSLVNPDMYTVPHERLMPCLDKLVELLSKLISPVELYAREFILVKRMEKELAADEFEKFLQMEAVRRKQSYVFQAAYIRVLVNISKKIALEVWLRFLRYLISIKSLVNSEIEIQEIERVLGANTVDRATLELHEELFSKQLFQSAELEDLLKKLEGNSTPAELILVCRQFRNTYPENLKVQHKLLALYEGEGMKTEALQMRTVIGATNFQKRNYRGTEKVFIKLFSEKPGYECPPIYLYACLLARGRIAFPKTSVRSPMELSELRDFVAKEYQIKSE